MLLRDVIVDLIEMLIHGILRDCLGHRLTQICTDERKRIPYACSSAESSSSWVKVSILLRSDDEGPTEQKVERVDLADERFVLRRDALNVPATFQVEKKPAEQANRKIQKNERNYRAPLKTINPDL